ncbi:MAG: alpha/beta hydrolase [Acidobacteriaceae bacterium]|jgi:pimeloyl-ACP methyl ester carboxylesterase
MQQETPQPGFEEAFVDVAGARVCYLHAGTGRPMLLIHGLVGSSADWRNNIGALARHASVYAIDLVNMGKSQRVGGLDATLAATANRIIAVMNALGVGAADMVGHSHGGAVALMLAALHPKRVHRLILFAPANPYNRSTDPVVRLYSSWWGGLAAWAVPYLPASIQRIALGGMYGGAARVADSDLQEIADCLRSPSSLRHVLRITRGWFAEEAKLKAALRRVKRVRTLLVWGDRDGTVSLSSGIKLHRKLRASELMVLPGGGHAVFEEAPEESNRIMLEWLGRHPLSTPRRHDLPRVASARRTRSTAAVRSLSPEA